jgi:hypothetical protein
MTTDPFAETPFVAFPKTARLFRRCLITEKIDGTNAQICIVPRPAIGTDIANVTVVCDDYLIYAGSRNRWITPGNDNFGFAAWVRDNAQELVGLGAGRHFGEWWGSGINRAYGHKNGARHFSLFNARRWVQADSGTPLQALPNGDPKAEPVMQEYAPACCRVVPILFDGIFDTHAVTSTLQGLREFGSVAEPGFMRPEGVVVFHEASLTGYKVLLENDEQPKGVQP